MPALADTGPRAENVLFATWYEGLSPLAGDAPLSAREFDDLLRLREQVSRVLEPMRASGEIGAALDAEITLACGVADQNWLSGLLDELRFFFISGDVALVADDDAGETSVTATPTKKSKCVRCWQRRDDVGTAAGHPQLCTRCVSNVEGPGEDRQWF